MAFKIVEFAVAGEDVAAIDGVEWLAAVFEVVDGEAGVAEGYAFFPKDVLAAPVWAAVVDGFELFVEVLGGGLGSGFAEKWPAIPHIL